MIKAVNRKAALLGTVVTAASVQAYAAVPEGVQTAISGAGTDAVTVGGYVIAAVAAIFGIFLMIRVLR